MMKKSNKKGFTLVELIVVIAIMAILAAVLVPTVTSKIRDARESGAKSDMSAIANSIQSEIISITSGLPSTDNQYVVGANGSVTGLKTPGTDGTMVSGKVTIAFDAANGFTITHSDLSAQKYTVSLAGEVKGPIDA